MARDYYDESKKRRKVVKKSQPSSTSINKSIKQAQERGSKRTKETNVKSQQSFQNTRTSSVSGRSTSSNRHRQDQQTQRTAQPTRRASVPASSSANNQRRNTPATASEMRRQNAQNQKSTAGVTREQQEKTKQRFATAKEMMNQRAEEGRKQKMGENSVATKEQKETVERAIRNTPSLVKKAAIDAGEGHLKTIADITEMTASSKKGVQAKAMKMGIQDDPRQMRWLEKERAETAKQAKAERERLQKKQDKRQAEWDEKTKNAKGLEKAYYGAVESGVGMATDMVIGLGTPGASLAAMGSRTYGSTRGQAQKEGATEKEDRLYSLLQAGKEVGTEMMLPGAGVARKAYGRVGIPLAEKAANRLVKGLSGRAADVAHSGLKLALGMGEENFEEAVGWGLDPIIKEYTYGKNVRQRNAEEAREAMNRISDNMRSQIKDENDAASASAYLSSDSFLEDTIKDYMAEGMNEEQAEKAANRMRDFLTASLIGDTDTMAQIEDEMSNEITGHSLRKDYSIKELLETVASTSLLTGVTGLPGTVTTAMKGSTIRDELGDEGVRALAKTAIDFEDETDSYKGQAARDRIDSGKELTNTQVYELAEATQKQIEKDSRRQEASVDNASKQIRSENLVSPYGVNANGEMVLDETTDKNYESSAKSAETTIKTFVNNSEEKESITDTEIRDGSRAIAGFKTGIFTLDDANELNYSNTAVREAFKEETGIDLNQYVVKDKNGKVDIPKTNAATKDALFAMASDNLVESAREATVNWMDNVKGEVVSQVTARMGAEGSLALQSALDDVDERNRSEYMMVANASDMLYQSALNLGTEWDNVKTEATKMFPNISEEKLQAMYKAGLDDRAKATYEYEGKKAKLGEAIASANALEDSDRANVTGKVFVDTETPLKGTVVRAFTEVATNLGVDIHLVDNLPTASGQQANGMYDKGTIYINANSSFEQNMGYIFMHEVTHHLKEYAPEEYAALERLVREKWFEYDDAQMQSEIAKRIDLYSRATNGKQTLTETEALEEIIADAAHEFLNDPNFANEIAEDNPSLAKAVLESIRNALRMLRRILSTGSIDDETHMNSLFSQLDIFDEAERLWLTAYRTAVANKAALAIDNWQDEVNAQSGSTERLSLSDSNLTVQGNTARWTDSRIDSLIRENGASDERYSKAWAAMMSPRDFLKLTIDDGTLEKWMQDENETMPLDEERLRGEGQTPFLIIEDASSLDDFSYRVIGHEGRHRMIALMNAGVESVPVAIRGTEATKYKKTSIPELTLAAQSFYGEGGVNNEARVNASDLVPIKESNRDELIEKFGGDADVRFSISAPVERVRDLVAVHNVWPDDLIRSLNMGGLAMPSIAVTKAEMGHAKYGSISLLFKSDTIDPERSRDNRVWGGDAYTPTFPDISRKFDEEKGREIEKHLIDILGAEGRMDFASKTKGLNLPNFDQDNLADKLRYWTVPHEAYANDMTLQLAYLTDTGNSIEVPMMDSMMQGQGAAFWEKLSEQISEADYEEYNKGSLTVQERMDRFEPIIREARKDAIVNDGDGAIKEFYKKHPKAMEKFDEPLHFAEVDNYMQSLNRYYQEGGLPRVTDQSKLREELDSKLDRDGYNEWVDNLFDGIVESEGIRNDKDIFTPSGNRRSWESLHEPVTIGNVVSAMKSGMQQGKGNFGGIVRGAAQKEYKSIDEIRADENRLQMMDDEEYRKLLDEAEDIVNAALEAINDHNPQSSSYYYRSALDVGGYVAEILNTTKKKETIKKKLLNDYDIEATDFMMDELMDGIEAIAEIPTGYFEAKPARAVDFSEVAAAIVPDVESPVSTEIRERLEEQGVEVISYKADSEEDRKAKLNEAADELNLRFSISKDIMNTLEDNFNEYKEDKANLRIATEAIADLRGVSVTGENLSGQRWSLDETASQRGMDNRADSGISSARTIAKGITSSLVNEGYIDFVGQKVESPEDLAKLGQVLRDPRFETFRLVLTKGNKIVSFQSCSARMPGLSPVHNEASDAVFYEKIKEQMDKLGADGYYLMHNHPSGDVTASEDDRRVTANAIFKLGSEAFKGHVILDHDKYGLISNMDALSAPGSVSLFNKEAPIYGQQTIDLIHEPEIDHPLLGEKAKNGEIVASIGEKVNTSNDYSVVIYVSSKLEVRGIQEVSNKEIEKDLGKFKSFIREQGVEFGSISALLYSPSGSDVSFSTIESLFVDGIILDAVYGDTHFFDLGLARNGDPSVMGRSRDEINSRITVYESVAGTQDYNSIRYSITPKMDADYMNAVNSNNMEEAQKLVNEAAKMAGYGLHVYHGTLSEPFTRFKRPAENWSSHGGGRPGFIYASVDEDYAAIYSFAGEPFSSDYEEGFVMEGYMNIDNMIDVGDVDGLIFKNNGWDHPDYENDPESLFSKDATKEFKNLCKVMDMTPYELVHALGEELYYDSENIYQLVNSPEFAQLIKDKGYDGIKLLESGSDAYGILEPTQIKSADTVTYAEDGSIIPLSERFNPENDDIRYSLPTQSAQGNILSDGQMEYFKNSQARDEQGRLVPVYHTTNIGGYTIFDPTKSDDRRSIFFASNFAVSQTYGRDASNPIYTYEVNAVDDFKHYLRANRNDAALSIMSNEMLMNDFKNEKNMRGAISEQYIESANGEFTWYLVHEADYMSLSDYLGNNPGASANEFYLDAYITGVEEGWINPKDWTIGVTIPNTSRSSKPFVYGKNINQVIKTLNTRLETARAQYNPEERRGLQGYYKTYLNLENPLIIDANGANWNSIPYGNYNENAVLAIKNITVQDIRGQIYVNVAGDRKVDNEWQEFRESKTIDYELDHDEIPNAVWNQVYDFFIEQGLADRVADDYADGTFFDYNGLDTYDENGNKVESEARRYRTRQLAEIAQKEGHDGVIIRNCYDIGAGSRFIGHDALSDIYIAFSSNQVKDVNNLNPTENPDIRFSITPEDEVKSKMAYEYAMDDSYEALEYYEQRLADLTEEAAENRPIKKFSEEKIAEFYTGLRSADSWVHTDPIEEEDAVRMAQSKNDFFANLNAKWNDRWRTGGEVLNVKSVKSDVRNLVMGVMQNSDTDSQYKNDLVKKTLFDVRTAYQLLKQDRPEVASELLYYSAQRMIDNVQFYVDGTFDQYKDLKHYLRNTRISLGEEYWSDVEYDKFRKRNAGRLKLVKGKTNVDQVYQELEEMFPEFFNEEEVSSVPDQLLQIEHVLDTVQPYKEAYSSEAAAELAFDIADGLYDIMMKGDEVRSLADTYKARYDAKTKAMKQRHAEAMLRVRMSRDEKVQKANARLREYKEEQKEQKLHRKEFESIQKSYDTLKDRLLSNTADSNIPEQYKKELAGLLAAFDLQTVRSKQLEKTKMRRSQKAIKMSAIRTALRQIETRTQQFFHVNDAITDIIDELLGVNAEYPAAASIEGKTIDELSVDELIRIDKLLKALVHEFNTYKNVRIQDRNEKAQDIADAQVTSALDHAKKFGPGTDWHGIRGGIDKVLNMDEVTPAYMFRMIDRENKGLGMMWKELERSHDKYIRNTEQLSKWMSEITGKYHNKGRFGNKYGADEIAEWRRMRSVQDFNLTNGSISITPAQMMSLAMLANRPQAYQHMIGAGVVVAPVNFQAKLETDLKRKTNRALPLILTDADIKLIVSQLTPEQRKMAEDLQQLMANQMAEWGNEASMDVLGIRLFEEKDYFPIKSDRAALEKDLTADQFEQAIRNFGFTKAVAPGARNAIMIDDIFDVVTEHCNNMNLYNSYSKTLNDFMKVYNKHTFQEDGSDYSVAQALGHAYSQKTTKFIMEFVKDVNGNVSRGRDTGIESLLQGQLANAKKASVFANIRVLLQQPAAITRAFAVINPKYLKGIKIEKGAMEEMFEHCPIAKWKSWGYYDINMGKNIEDIIMNEGNFLDDLATQAYGAADNVTWAAIWQMVKAEMKDTHPDVVEGSDEFWYQCNERMREIVDLTQVVDSPMHRSHAMRDKNFFVKMATSFMAEPTLTFNMVRDGYIRAKEAWDSGNKKEAASIISKTMSVYILQAATVAAAAAIADAIRGKKPDGGGDDEDKDFFSNWWANTLANFKDEIALWNKVYYIKDIASIFEGYEAWNLGTQGISNFVKGYNQLTKKLSEGSKTSWWDIYQNLLGGIGYMSGIPFKTLMKDGKAIFEMLGGKLPEKLVGEEKSDAVVDKDSAFGRLIAPKDKSEGKSASAVRVSEEEHWYDYGNNPLSVKDGSALDNFLNHFGINLTGTEKAAAIQAQKDKEIAEKTEDISKSVADLDGEEKAKKTWSKVTTEMKDVEGRSVKELIAEGEFSTIDKYREMYIAAGNDADYFDSRNMAETKKALKKSIAYEQTDDEMYAQQEQKAYLRMNGMTDAEISKMAYKSDIARDVKVAMMLGDEELVMEAVMPLVQAGLSQEDFNKLWENRNHIDLKKYDGRYKDKLKSTGNYVFPADGIITSDFGNRNSPGGIGSTNHKGLDIAASDGTPIAAADGGIVVYSGWDGGLGKCVRIKHDDGTITEYGHLSWWDVNVGDAVGQGQEIGLMGSTGNSTGPHLHFGVIKNDEYVDPKEYINTYDREWNLDA